MGRSQDLIVTVASIAPIQKRTSVRDDRLDAIHISNHVRSLSYRVRSSDCPVSNTCMLLSCLRQPRDHRAGASGGLASHIGTQARVGHRIEQPVDRPAIEASRYARVRGKHIGEGAALDHGGLSRVVDDVRALAGGQASYQARA